MNPPPSRVSGDANGDARRTGRAGDRDRREDIDKLILLVGDQVVEHQVFVIEDAVLGLQGHVDREGQCLVRIRDHLRSRKHMYLLEIGELIH